MREEPKLEEFRHYFDVLRTREGHVRSPEVEAVLATVSDPLDLFRGTHAILADAEIEYGTVKTSGRRGRGGGRHDGDPAARPRYQCAQGSMGAICRRLLAFKNTFASLITGGVKNDVFHARTRNYRTAVEAALHQPISPGPYMTICSTQQSASSRLASLLGRQAPHPGPRQAARLRCVRAAQQVRP